MNTPAVVSINRKHIEQLFSKLGRHGEQLRNEETAEVCRLFFVDSDVMAAYINGHEEDIRSGWPSLFSLVREDKPTPEHPADSVSRTLTDATARSISDFIFGRFRESRGIQSNRLWLTPEYSRELDGIVHSVLHQMPKVVPGWQDTIIAEFQGLAAADSFDEQIIEQRLEDIFALLIENSPHGKLARAYDIRHRFTVASEQAPLFPRSGPGTAFMMRADTPEFLKRTNDLAKQIFELLLANLQEEFPNVDWEPAFAVKRSLFMFHSPKRSMREYLWHAETDPAVKALIPTAPRPGWLEINAHIAAQQVADVYSLARLCTLGEFLNLGHSSNGRLRWEVCLLTGSILLERLEGAIKNIGLGDGLFVIHPLSSMRFDKFLRPEEDGRLSLDRGDALTAGHDYALNAITSSQNSVNDIDVEHFVKSLTRLLQSSSAAFAPQRDRSLRSVRRRLTLSPTFDEQHYLRVVRDVIGREFVKTYIQVNQLAQPQRNRLPMISLPWMSLQLKVGEDSTASGFVRLLHDKQFTNSTRLDQRKFSVLFKQIFDEDATGYSAMLCAALGYLAKGQVWIRAAETLANSAVVTAIEAPQARNDRNGYLPEGNEALYLSAFISRMCVDPSRNRRESAIAWRDTHITQMSVAYQRLDDWKRRNRDLAYEVSDELPHLPAWRSIELRLRSEELARDIFCLLMDTLAPVEELKAFDGEVPAVLNRISQAISELDKMSTAEGISNKELELAFIRAQLFVAAVQGWACARILLSSAPSNLLTGAISTIEQSVATTASHFGTGQIANSALVSGLWSVFERHRITSVRQMAHVRKTTIKFGNFAELDSVRVPFFKRLACLAQGADFREALPQNERHIDVVSAKGDPG